MGKMSCPGSPVPSLPCSNDAAEAALRAIEDELADPTAWSTPKKIARSTERHERAKQTVEELYSRWEQVAG